MPLLNPTELRAGTVITLDGVPCLVLKYEHNKMGRGGATVRIKVKNLKSGALFEKTFRGNERAEEAEVSHGQASFLYRDQSGFTFMDLDNYDQFTLSETEVGDAAKWLNEGQEVSYLSFAGKPLSITLPIKMEFTVTYTEPGIKGNTVSNAMKPATLNSGASILVPLFIKIGDKIIVNTEESSYVERSLDSR